MTIISGYWKGWSKSRPLVGTKSILIPVPVVSCGIPTPYRAQYSRSQLNRAKLPSLLYYFFFLPSLMETKRAYMPITHQLS